MFINGVEAIQEIPKLEIIEKNKQKRKLIN